MKCVKYCGKILLLSLPKRRDRNDDDSFYAIYLGLSTTLSMVMYNPLKTSGKPMIILMVLFPLHLALSIAFSLLSPLPHLPLSPLHLALSMAFSILSLLSHPPQIILIPLSSALRLQFIIASSLIHVWFIYPSCLHPLLIPLASCFHPACIIFPSCLHLLSIFSVSSKIHACRLFVKMGCRCSKKTKAFSTHDEGLRFPKRRPS